MKTVAEKSTAGTVGVGEAHCKAMEPQGGTPEAPPTSNFRQHKKQPVPKASAAEKSLS